MGAGFGRVEAGSQMVLAVDFFSLKDKDSGLSALDASTVESTGLMNQGPGFRVDDATRVIDLVNLTRRRANDKEILFINRTVLTRFS
jgi:hypothetical protein